MILNKLRYISFIHSLLILFTNEVRFVNDEFRSQTQLIAGTVSAVRVSLSVAFHSAFTFTLQMRFGPYPQGTESLVDESN